ncbi:cupin domain-containing protein [Saccharibacillus endophyticus]|uniref:Cupin domain-containing protein n=1 Tax=Saccharibacillus endophyticus TaxID=2060666 RepID=A0ABQ1ZXN1_9BACL|nr:cupin domain-containing protein [Saccharibacillus endophyticus]GGH79791.1 hypothetical protein GCM10007362_27120 [Saccharibacillus endophyticus]
MKSVSSEQAELLGIKAVHHEMDNGEKRFRLVGSDGSSYIRTESAADGAWQNSHFHERMQEIYIVEKGWIAYAELTDEQELMLRLLTKGESLHVPPKRPHNIYMPPDSVTHVVKFGGDPQIDPDWFAATALDRLTLNLSERELRERLEAKREEGARQ